MGLVSLCILLLVAIASIFGKYVHIQIKMSWPNAQRYCQAYFTDLAIISNKEDMDSAQQVIGTFLGSVWIGLQRNSTDNSKWVWSRGGAVTRTFWASGQPDILNQRNGVIRGSLWYDEYQTDLYTVLCSSIKVIRMPMQWEDAVDYCKMFRWKMASVTSKEKLMLIQNELRKGYFTGEVWIGMRFLAGQWVWVDGKQVTYESWGVRGKPGCPAEGAQCVALSALELHSSMAINSGTDPQQLYLKEWNVCDCTKLLYSVCE